MCPVERSVKLLPGSFLSMQRDWTKAGSCLTRLQRQTDFVAPISMHHWQGYSVKSETLATMYATVQNLSTRVSWVLISVSAKMMIMTASVEAFLRAILPVTLLKQWQPIGRKALVTPPLGYNCVSAQQPSPQCSQNYHTLSGVLCSIMYITQNTLTVQ